MKKLILLLATALSTALVAASVALAGGEGPPPPPPPHNCSGATANPRLLWPPNHKYRLITVSVPGFSSGQITVTGVTQDEPTNTTGDGNTAIDAARGPSSNTVYVRAERSGNRDGRVYRIAFSTSTCQGAAFVGVAHDQGNNASKGGKVPIDSGALRYNSFG